MYILLSVDTFSVTLYCISIILLKIKFFMITCPRETVIIKVATTVEDGSVMSPVKRFTYGSGNHSYGGPTAYSSTRTVVVRQRTEKNDGGRFLLPWVAGPITVKRLPFVGPVFIPSTWFKRCRADAVCMVHFPCESSIVSRF